MFVMVMEGLMELVNLVSFSPGCIYPLLDNSLEFWIKYEYII